jgi:hypothetical protein
MSLLPNAHDIADALTPVVSQAEDKLTAEVTGQILPALRDALVEAFDGLQITVTVNITKKKGNA